MLFGALTVADAWVLGWSTDHVLLPAFDTGTTTTGGLVAILALFLGVAILRAVGIVARRLGAGIMQYRMQAAYRREVTASTCGCRCRGTSGTRPGSCCPTRTPTSRPRGHRSRRCRWRSAPLAMMVIAIVQMLFVDLAMAAVGLLVFPLVTVATSPTSGCPRRCSPGSRRCAPS